MKLSPGLLIIIGCIALMSGYVFVDMLMHPRSKSPEVVYHTLLDSLKSEVKALQKQQDSYTKDKDVLRTDIVQLQKERQSLADQVTKYTATLNTIKNQYATIPAHYRDLSVDSTRLLFEKYFDY